MWQHAVYEWIQASSAAQENTKLLLADPTLNTQECTRRMLRLDDAESALEEYADDPALPAQVTRYLKAKVKWNERSDLHPGCFLSSNPAKCCKECSGVSTEYFTSRDWLRDQGLELLRS